MDKKIDAAVIKLLVEKKGLSEEAILSCFKQAEKKEISPIPLIARNANLTEREILEEIGRYFHAECIDLKTISVDKTILQKIPIKIASYYKFIPIKLENRVLLIAVAYPLDIKTQDEIRTHLGYNIETVLTCEDDITEALKQYYGLGADTLQKMSEQKAVQGGQETLKQEERVEDIEALSKDATITQLVNQILFEAYKKRATDVHFEPYRNKIRLRYRIDGILYDANISSEIKNFLIPILSRIKIMSKLNIVERRLPQDGRAIVKVQDQNIDLRVSFIPTPHGESVVIRILPTVMLFNLDRLGLSSSELDTFQNLIEKPHGIIFLTGPTGSGKTTTLYACLSRINTNELKIITIEDPIEYELEGITQIQVLPEIGLDFARGLRSMLRHDPDVMMVGEVRDFETAEIAIRVALTGHLVFSTLHTNDSASGITRLIDIGVEPYLVASSVNAFIAQRLVRMNCSHCKVEDREAPLSMKKQIARDLGYDNVNAVRIFKGKGCQACNHTGYFGRTAIYEILLINPAIKELIIKKVSSDQIKKLVISQGMKTLRHNGWIAVLEGITTPDEILRVTQADEILEVTEKEQQQILKEAPVLTKTAAPLPAALQPVQETAVNPVQALNPIDKRVYVRLDSRVYISYRLFKQKGGVSKGVEYEPELTGITKNISAGGLLFNTSEHLNTGTMIELSMQLPEEKEIQCLARVVRVEEVIANKDYETAVCFLDLPNSERARLNRYIMRTAEK